MTTAAPVGGLLAEQWMNWGEDAILPSAGFTWLSSGENRPFAHTSRTGAPQDAHSPRGPLTSTNGPYPQDCGPSTSTAGFLYLTSLKNRGPAFVGTTGDSHGLGTPSAARRTT